MLVGWGLLSMLPVMFSAIMEIKIKTDFLIGIIILDPGQFNLSTENLNCQYKKIF